MAHYLVPYTISRSLVIVNLFNSISHHCGCLTLLSSCPTSDSHSFIQEIMARLCKFLAFSTTLMSVLSSSRVDTHIHALSPQYIEAVNAAGGDPSGYPTPEWTLDATIESMNQINTDIGKQNKAHAKVVRLYAKLTPGILSLSTPGVPVVGTGKSARDLARSINEFFANSTTEPTHNNRLGFFGTLPDWTDVNGTIAELDYLFQEQKLCNGVTAYTSYGGKLLGHQHFAPIWNKLQEYKALVFLHPGTLAITPEFIATALPQPIVDYPLATTRTAVDLVMTQTLRQCPDVDVILSHAGGTLPFVAERALGSLVIPEIETAIGYNAVQARRDFGRFYYDTALSTSPAQLRSLLDFADPSHIIFGSDFPYAPAAAINTMVIRYSAFVAKDDRGWMVSPERLRENSLALLKKHALSKTF